MTLYYAFVRDGYTGALILTINAPLDIVLAALASAIPLLTDRPGGPAHEIIFKRA